MVDVHVHLRTCMAVEKPAELEGVDDVLIHHSTYTQSHNTHSTPPTAQPKSQRLWWQAVWKVILLLMRVDPQV